MTRLSCSFVNCYRGQACSVPFSSMPRCSCSSVCVHLRLWQRKTSSCAHNSRSLKHAKSNPSAPPMPPVLPWSGWRSDSTGDRLWLWSNRRRSSAGVGNGASSSGVALRVLDGPRFRESCKPLSGRWRTTTSRGASDASPTNSGSSSACRSAAHRPEVHTPISRSSVRPSCTLPTLADLCAQSRTRADRQWHGREFPHPRRPGLIRSRHARPSAVVGPSYRERATEDLGV